MLSKNEPSFGSWWFALTPAKTTFMEFINKFGKVCCWLMLGAWITLALLSWWESSTFCLAAVFSLAFVPQLLEYCYVFPAQLSNLICYYEFEQSVMGFSLHIPLVWMPGTGKGLAIPLAGIIADVTTIPATTSCPILLIMGDGIGTTEQLLNDILRIYMCRLYCTPIWNCHRWVFF